MLTKNLKKMLLLVALAFFASLVLRFWHATDDEAIESRVFISKNKEVQEAVGNIIGIDFKKKLTYQGTSSESAYVEFTYYIRGSVNNILIVVRGYGEPTKYNVYRIKTYNKRL